MSQLRYGKTKLDEIKSTIGSVQVAVIAYAPLVGELDQQVEGVLTRQVLDAASSGFMRSS